VLTGGIPVERLVAMRLSALIIDLALLGPQAWIYLERVATELPALPIVVCTGQSSVAQRVRGLRLGADDWITKPCHPEELIARVEAVLRRRRPAAMWTGADAILAGEIEIRPAQYQVVAHDHAIGLTPREFEIVHVLAAANNQVLHREDLYQQVWGYAMSYGDRSVDVYVQRLRRKLDETSPAWRYIHTHFGIGYRFAAERLPASNQVMLGDAA
jgi:DNA-binding response OmpR family regulator